MKHRDYGHYSPDTAALTVRGDLARSWYGNASLLRRAEYGLPPITVLFGDIFEEDE